MRFVKHFITGLTLGLLALTASAGVGNPELDKEYKQLKAIQPVEPGKKIEVIEFFAYYCPHCNALEPLLADWVKKNSDKINFKRIHVPYQGLEAQQKLFFALEAMGKVEQYHAKVFEAYHVQHNRLNTDALVLEFVTNAGIDKKAFMSAYNGFSTNIKVTRSERLLADYEINSWPTLIIDGRYTTAPTLAAVSMGRVTEEQQNKALLPVLDFLVSKAQKEKAGSK
jgi:thiol:disulfide interchange protein DsbA